MKNVSVWSRSRLEPEPTQFGWSRPRTSGAACRCDPSHPLLQDVLSELESLLVQYERESKDPVAQKRLLNKMMLPLIASQEIQNIPASFGYWDKYLPAVGNVRRFLFGKRIQLKIGKWCFKLK